MAPGRADLQTTLPAGFDLDATMSDYKQGGVIRIRCCAWP